MKQREYSDINAIIRWKELLRIAKYEAEKKLNKWQQEEKQQPAIPIPKQQIKKSISQPTSQIRSTEMKENENKIKLR